MSRGTLDQSLINVTFTYRTITSYGLTFQLCSVNNIYLVFHQSNQRRNHNSCSLHNERRQLVTQTLTATCRHQYKSIIAQVSAARPEIAAYHFTTLTPVLGVVRIDAERSFVLADIPGLIEGAHEGVGLGHDFLRHVERTKVLLHVLDVSGTDGRDPIEDFEKINFELSQYSERLGRRKQLVVANKMDLPEGQENFQRVKEYVEAKGYEIVKASAATGEGLQELMYKAYEMLQNFEPEPDEEENIIMDEIDPDSFEITACADADFEVKGKNIERLVAMTNFDNDEALYRFQLIWKSLGIDAALKEKGIQEGQTVRIRDMVFEFKEY